MLSNLSVMHDSPDVEEAHVVVSLLMIAMVVLAVQGLYNDDFERLPKRVWIGLALEGKCLTDWGIDHLSSLR